jgi:Tfp pilus assembly protein PilF
LFEAYRAIERSMLSALDHDARTVIQKIKKTLQKKDYPAILRDLRYLVRLDGGKSALAELVYVLGENDRQFIRSKEEGEKSQDKVTLDEILSDARGKYVVKFIADHLPIGERDWQTKIFLWRIEDDFIELADRLYKRIIDAAPHDPVTLRNYAFFLAQQRGDLDGAERYYRRALEADPKGVYLLGNYAFFLAQQRGDLDGAESYYRRALEVDPNDVYLLGNYANFLAQQRGDLDEAERYYWRALETDPKDVYLLGNYAIFLARKRDDLDGAESYYRRALEADPKHANNLGNYGQFLVGIARLSEGEQLLVSAFEYSDQYDRSNVGNIAEICYSLWLVSRMQGHSTERWEGYFKFFIQKGFKRHPWSFERMLDQAKKILSPEEFEYAEALGRGFLDESQVSNLDRYERWRIVEPLDPMEAGNKYSERTSASISSTSL